MLIVGPDPDWQARSQQRIADSINLFLNLQERKRTERENERQRHMAMLGEHPELADGDYGTALLKKYGGDDPLSSMVTTIRSREKLANEALDGPRAFAQAVGAEAGRRAGERKAVSEMSDSTMGWAPFLRGELPVPVPNEEKQQRAAALEQLPDVTQSAFESMSPADRAKYLTWAQLNKDHTLKFQEGFDPKSLPEGVRGLRATGASTADTAKAARVTAGLDPSPRTLAETADRAQKRAEAEATAAETARKAAKLKFERDEILARIKKAKPGRGGKTDEEKQAEADAKQAKEDRKDAKDEFENAFKPHKGDGRASLPMEIQTGLRDLALGARDSGYQIDNETLTTSLRAAYDELVGPKYNMKPMEALAAMRASAAKRLGSR